MSNGSLSFRGISVVIPLYNKKKFLMKTLESVLSQGYPYYEVIVVDDGSTDGSLELVESIKSEKIRVISQGNAGPGAARNRGVEESKHSWVAFIDADDIWEAEHLSELDRLRKTDPDVGVVATRSRKIQSYHDVASVVTDGHGEFMYIDYLEEARKRVGVVHTSAAMVNKEKFQELGGFPSFKIGEDVNLWIRMSLHFRILGSEKTTSFHLLGTGGLMDSADLYSSSRDAQGLDSLEELSPLMGSLESIYSQLPRSSEFRKKLGRYINAKILTNVKVLIVKSRISLAKEISRLFVSPVSLEGATYRIFLKVSPVWLVTGLNRSRIFLRTLR